MPLPALTTPVPHSVGLNRPQRPLPPGACDSHMHIFDPRFAPSSHWPRTPPVAPVAVYRQLQARLGTTRTVVVTPSTYGSDNACMLDALDQLGDAARGVAVVGEEVSADELAHLAARRVRGLRVNFVSPQSWGTTTPDMLADLRTRLERGQLVCPLFDTARFVQGMELGYVEMVRRVRAGEGARGLDI